MGNYVIGVGNYVIAIRSTLGNSVIVHNLPSAISPRLRQWANDEYPARAVG